MIFPRDLRGEERRGWEKLAETRDRPRLQVVGRRFSDSDNFISQSNINGGGGGGQNWEILGGNMEILKESVSEKKVTNDLGYKIGNTPR